MIRLSVIVFCSLISMAAFANSFEQNLRVRVLELYDQEMQTHADSEAVIESLKDQYFLDLEQVDDSQRADYESLGHQVFQDLHDGRMDQFMSSDLGPSTSVQKGLMSPGMKFNLLAPSKEISPYTTSYATQKEFMESLTSNGLSTDWYTKAHIEYNTLNSTTYLGDVSVQIKGSILGVEASIGPRFTFTRELESIIELVGDGLYPAIREVVRNGKKNVEFDFVDRDEKGNPLIVKGKTQRRLVYFECKMTLTYKSQYEGSGEFRVMGLGGKVSATKDLGHSLTYYSRKIVVPESIGGVYTTPQMITRACETDFPQFKVNNKKLIDSIDSELKTVISSSLFYHPQTKCASDKTCTGWYNKLSAGQRQNSVARCVEINPEEKFMGCQLRSKNGGPCVVKDAKGSRISGNSYENLCDEGLTCQKTKDAEWFPSLFQVYAYAEGKCLPPKKKAN